MSSPLGALLILYIVILLCRYSYWLGMKKGEEMFKTKQTLVNELEAVLILLECKQAKIDSLMLEYCPDEMTKEQLDVWGKHQKPVKEQIPYHNYPVFHQIEKED